MQQSINFFQMDWSSIECAEQGSPVTAAAAMIIFLILLCEQSTSCTETVEQLHESLYGSDALVIWNFLLNATFLEGINLSRYRCCLFSFQRPSLWTTRAMPCCRDASVCGIDGTSSCRLRWSLHPLISFVRVVHDTVSCLACS